MASIVEVAERVEQKFLRPYLDSYIGAMVQIGSVRACAAAILYRTLCERNETHMYLSFSDLFYLSVTASCVHCVSPSLRPVYFVLGVSLHINILPWLLSLTSQGRDMDEGLRKRALEFMVLISEKASGLVRKSKDFIDSVFRVGMSLLLELEDEALRYF